MKSKLSSVPAVCSPQRVVAGIVFIPLLAYSFAPYRNVALSFPERLVFWTGVMVVALGATWVAGNVVREHLFQKRLLIRDITFAGLILALFAPSLWVLSWMVFTYCGERAPGLVSVLPYGALFATGLLLVRQRETEGVSDVTLCRPRLHQRLPEEFDGQVYRLTGRDHYVDVVTCKGTFTIRSRLADAIAEMEPVAGYCAHRSHWITAEAIAGVEKQGAKTFLRLRNNDLVPVSRKYYPGLEEAGLI